MRTEIDPTQRISAPGQIEHHDERPIKRPHAARSIHHDRGVDHERLRPSLNGPADRIRIVVDLLRLHRRRGRRIPHAAVRHPRHDVRAVALVHVPEAVQQRPRPPHRPQQMPAPQVLPVGLVENAQRRAVRHHDVDRGRHGVWRNMSRGAAAAAAAAAWCRVGVRRVVGAVVERSVGEGPAAGAGRVGRGVDGKGGAVGEGESVRALIEVGDAGVFGEGAGHDVEGGLVEQRTLVVGHVFDSTGLVERDVVVASVGIYWSR